MIEEARVGLEGGWGTKTGSKKTANKEMSQAL